MNLKGLLATTFLIVFCITSGLQAQRTIIIPLQFAFNVFDEQVEESMIGFLIAAGTLTPHRFKVDSLKTAELAPALHKSLSLAIKETGASTVFLNYDDLSDRLRKDLEAILTPSLFLTATKIRSRKYDDDISNKNAPIFNQLCDQYEADQLLFTGVSAINRSKKYRKKGIKPTGMATVYGVLFDGNSGLPIKHKRKIKGENDSSSVRLTPYKLNSETLGELLASTVLKLL